MSEKLPSSPQDNSKPESAPKKKLQRKNLKIIIIVVVCAQLVLAVFAGIFLFKRGYTRSKDNTEGKIREEAYDMVYNASESAYHVSNRVLISLEGIKERADLEVLQIDSNYLYKSDETDKGKGLTIWYKIPATGTFTVDMRMAVFIVDNERQHVTVKLPKPAITQFRENYERIEELYYRDDRLISNGSIAEGEEIARKMLTKAHVEMKKHFEMTPAYYQAAEDSATRLIVNMIKAVNPDLKDLTVEVVFQ